MELDKLTDIVYNALIELGHRSCPHCQSYIGLEGYISGNDLAKWLEKKLPKEPLSTTGRPTSWWLVPASTSGGRIKGKYQDEYTKAFKRLIEAKLEGTDK